MAELAIPMLVASTALTATSQIMRGQEEARTAEFQRSQYISQQEQLKVQEETTKIAAAQAEAKRRNELTSSLEAISTIRSGRGVGGSSPTGMAIFDSIVSGAEGDISTERFNYLSRADVLRQNSETAGQAASMAGRKAQYSLLSGYLGAASTAADAGFRYASLERYGRARPGFGAGG